MTTIIIRGTFHKLSRTIKARLIFRTSSQEDKIGVGIEVVSSIKEVGINSEVVIGAAINKEVADMIANTTRTTIRTKANIKTNSNSNLSTSKKTNSQPKTNKIRSNSRI